MRRSESRAGVSLLDLVAADRAEYLSIPGRNPKSIPHWRPAEAIVIERFARGVLSKKFRNAVLAVEPCRAALARCAGGIGPELRTRQSVHRRLVSVAIELGRVRSRARWKPPEVALLDRYARYVAENRFRTARGAGTACREAITALHRRFPNVYAGIPERSLSTIQHELWPRVAKLRSRWFNSHWSEAELALVDRYARLLIGHRFPHVRAASKAACEATNRLHARLARRRGTKQPGTVRTLPGVFDQVLRRAKEIAPFQIPHRRWTAAERSIAARWTRKYDLHRRGRLTMNLYTIAALLQAELNREGYYRNLQACVTEIVGQRREGLASPSNRQKRSA